MTHLPPFRWEGMGTICMEDGLIQRPVSRRKMGRTTWFGRTKTMFEWNNHYAINPVLSLNDYSNIIHLYYILFSAIARNQCGDDSRIGSVQLEY